MNASWFHPAYVLLLHGPLLFALMWRKYSFRRGLQAFSMTLFATLFWLAAFEGQPTWPVDFFLFSDPLLALVHTIAGRVLVPLLLVSLAFVALALVMGRVFCSHVCPMGTLLDFSDKWLGRRQRVLENRGAYKRARKIKFVCLLVILAAAVAGFNLLGFGDPIVIFTRFAATIFHPVIMLLQDVGLLVLRPIGAWLGWTEVAYLELILPSFTGAILFVGLLILILVLSRMQPRFWCRHLCPLGAMLGWVGRYAPYRRRVSDKCNACDTCVRECPTGAIHEKGVATDRSECIVCRHCVKTCPEGAVKFTFTKQAEAVDLPGTATSRRMFLGGIAGGLAASLSMRADLLHPSDSFLPFPERHGRLIRPPGALPEPEFLSRCVRCGECMRACLTNTLQPDWHRAGLEGLWAPHMSLRHAACEQTCKVCGHVCPTEAIRPLSLDEKQHAKVGTAYIDRNRCLPWSQDHRCLICDEQCPYNAIVFKQDAQHHVKLPVVNPRKCNGCGQCEDKCPVLGESAIIVVPQGELRLIEGSYVEEAQALGLVFAADAEKLKDSFRTEEELFKKELPPGIEAEKPSLPPGIDPES
jgi:MauM/NapG family ferredoxin protein